MQQVWLVPDKITNIFGFRIHKRLRGKLQTVLEQIEHGHHVLQACAKSAVLRMYEKFSTFLRIEALSNNLSDFGLRKGLDNIEAIRKTLTAVTDRFAAFEAEALNVQVDFPLFPRIALPIASGRSKVATRTRVLHHRERRRTRRRSKAESDHCPRCR